RRDRRRNRRPAAARAERSRGATPPRHNRAVPPVHAVEAGEALDRANRPKANKDLSSALLVNVAEDPAALRDGLDELRPAAGIAQLLAQLGDEHVNDLGLRLVVR